MLQAAPLAWGGRSVPRGGPPVRPPGLTGVPAAVQARSAAAALSEAAGEDAPPLPGSPGSSPPRQAGGIRPPALLTALSLPFPLTSALPSSTFHFRKLSPCGFPSPSVFPPALPARKGVGAGSAVSGGRGGGKGWRWRSASPEPPRSAGSGPSCSRALALAAPATQPFPCILLPAAGLARDGREQGPRRRESANFRSPVKGPLGKRGLRARPDSSFGHSQAAFNPAPLGSSAAGRQPPFPARGAPPPAVPVLGPPGLGLAEGAARNRRDTPGL